MPWFVVVSVFCCTMTGSVAVRRSGSVSCGPREEGGGCPVSSICVLQPGGQATCAAMCDEQAVQHCEDEWEDFPGSGGLSQCYVADNKSSCSCLSFAYNTGSMCLSIWWVVGPAVGGAVLLITIFIIVIVIIIKTHRVRAGTSVEVDVEVTLEEDRMRSQTNASMMNFVEFPSRNVSNANLDEADSSFSTEEGHSKVGDSITPEYIQEDVAGRVSYINRGFGEHMGTQLEEQDRRSYHGFELYDNNFQREPEQLWMNVLYEGSGQGAPYLYDEVRQFPGHMSAYHNVQPYATSIRTIPRTSIILEEDDTV